MEKNKCTNLIEASQHLLAEIESQGEQDYYTIDSFSKAEIEDALAEITT